MKLNIDLGLLLIALVGRLTCQRVQSVITGDATCDKRMSFYADGVRYTTTPNDNKWRKSSPVRIPDDTELVAIKCVNPAGVGGIKMALSDGTETDVTWKCSATFEDNWNKVGFYDAAWENAIVPDYNNRKSKPESLNGKADWIWTSGYREGQDKIVYCRKVIKNPCALDTVRYFAYPFNDTKYYQCDNNVAKLRDCAPGTVWFQEDLTCGLDNLDTVPDCDLDIGCTGDTPTTADPEDCTKYYDCVDGEPIGEPRPCATGTAYNPVIDGCDHISNVPDCDSN